MSKIRVSDYIISYIASLGVREIFLISGGGNVSLIDSITKNKDVSYVCTHHEQAAAMAAESYGRVNENIGVCIVTFGPGSTNTLTGVAGVWLDSIPVLYISGQTKRETMIGESGLRQLGIQEVNIIGMVKPITKYATVVMNPNDIKYHLLKAVFLAKSGRPGPVFLDIPSDVLGASIDEENLKDFDPTYENLQQLRGANLAKKSKQSNSSY